MNYLFMKESKYCLRIFCFHMHVNLTFIIVPNLIVNV